MSTRVVVIVVLVVLGAAQSALAWGPATHIELADSLLNQLGLLPAAIAAILSKNRIAYLYGNIAADLVFAKRWSRIKQFCHHWSTAFRLLDSAEDERDASFAYGYLSHLAADTVAHGKYVPRQIVVSHCSVNFGHFYWEVRADACQREWVWTLLEEVLEGEHVSHHRALERQMTDTLLSFEVNRLLFDRVNGLAVRSGVRRTVGLWSRLSRWELSEELMAGYRSECLERMNSLLCDGARSPVLHEDPNGTSAFMQLRIRRREFRRMRRVGVPVQRRVLEAAVSLGPQLHPMSVVAAIPPRRIAVATSGSAGGSVSD